MPVALNTRNSTSRIQNRVCPACLESFSSQGIGPHMAKCCPDLAINGTPIVDLMHSTWVEDFVEKARPKCKQCGIMCKVSNLLCSWFCFVLNLVVSTFLIPWKLFNALSWVGVWVLIYSSVLWVVPSLGKNMVFMTLACKYSISYIKC